MNRLAIVTGFLMLLDCSAALAMEKTAPLKPPDRSSPRATLRTFLESADAVARFLAIEYRSSPTRSRFQRLGELAEIPVQCLDLSGLSPAARTKAGSAAALALYETLSRIELPSLEQVPGADELKSLSTADPPRWTIPQTEISLVQLKSGPRSGEFVFSADTVARAEEFYSRVRDLPYTRAVPFKGVYEATVMGGGWLIPISWIEALPPWLRVPMAGQSLWKWLALALVLGVLVALLRIVRWLSRRFNEDRPFLQALMRLLLPAFLLVAVPIVAYLALVQINFRGSAGSVIQVMATATEFLAGAWLCWRIAAVFAQMIIGSAQGASQNVDAHLVRICVRLLGLAGAVALIATGADQLGLPVYGIVAGLGIGGLAIALAAQPTIENLIGGLSLFTDKPVRVGDFCKYGNDMGTVEQIGIRSARIRGLDRTLTTIPNAALAKMPIVNFTKRERMLIRTVIGVRYETTPEQLRYILVKLREMLLAHPKIHHDPARARFIGFGASSLEIEVFAYAMTQEINEFLSVQEDVFLRVIDIVVQSGSGFAFPSQTLYMAQDSGLDPDKLKAAEAQVNEWREGGSLPFPNFSPEQMRQIRRSLVYPPPGSTEAAASQGSVISNAQTAAHDTQH